MILLIVFGNTDDLTICSLICSLFRVVYVRIIYIQLPMKFMTISVIINNILSNREYQKRNCVDNF